MIARRLLSMMFVLSLGMAGCVDENPAFFIERMVVPEEGCVASTASSETYNSHGLLDVSVKIGYLAFPRLQSELASSTSQGVTPERNNLFLKEYRVKVDLGDIPGNFSKDLTEFTEPISGMVGPGDVNVTGFKVIPDALAGQLSGVVPKSYNPTVVARVKAVAIRNGDEIETDYFDFPISLCNGCLVDLRASCPDPSDPDAMITGNICGLPQDQPVTCCPVSGKTLPVCYSTSDI